MLAEWELWACANTMDQEHGPDAPAAIAERIETLTRQDDVAGVATWKAITERYTRLIKALDQTALRH